jgi:hydroxymethylbilane synthase
VSVATKVIRVGARGSSLSLAQTGWLLEQLRTANPGLETELIVIKTQGDKDQTSPLTDMLWAPGAFVKEIEKALIDGDIDMAVHSLKDLPTEAVRGLTLAAIPHRAPFQDVLLTREPVTLDALPRGFVVATSSPRRAHQLKARCPHIETTPVRGNVPTRIRKLETGAYDGIVLAAAGLQRLSIKHEHVLPLLPPDFLPAPGQGALAAQMREHDPLIPLIARIDDHATRAAVTAERAFLAACGGGCHAALGALGTVQGQELTLRGQLFENSIVLTGEVKGSALSPEALGRQLASTIFGQRR